MTLRIAIAGATGTSGSLVVSGAHAASMEVVPITRTTLSAGSVEVARFLSDAGVDVVVNCAGPFAMTRRVVEDAAIDVGVSVAHLCGEPSELRDLFARDSEFERAGIAVVGAAGFATGIVELACWLALKGLNGPIAIEVAHGSSSSSIPSVGSLLSYLQDVDTDLHAHDDLRVVDLPSPIGARAMRELSSSLEWLVLPRAFPMIVADKVRTLHAVGPPRIVDVAANARPRPFLKDRAAIERMLEIRRSSQRGPTQEERDATSFAVVVTARDAANAHTVEMTGVDPYGVTAVIAIECARALTSDARRTGAKTPIDVVDPQRALAALANVGVRWKTSRVPTS